MQNQQLPRELTQRQKDQIEEAIQDVRFDLWTGEDDKILRRIEVEFGFDVPRDLQRDTQGVQRGTVEMALEIADVNKEQTITAPKDARPLSELQSTLGLGSLGGLGRLVRRRLVGRRLVGRRLVGRLVGRRFLRRRRSGGGTDLGSGGGSSGLDSRRSQRYLDCLGKAKRPADIEKCAAILEE